MSTSSATIDNLATLAQLIVNAITKTGATPGKGFNYAAFLKSPEFKAIEVSVQSLLGGLTRPNLDEAIAQIDAKRLEIIGSRDESQLSLDEEIRYAALGDSKLVLLGRDLSGAMNADVVSWLAEDALPLLVKVAPIVLPLLVAL